MGWVELLALEAVIPRLERLVRHEERWLDRVVRREGRDRQWEYGGDQNAMTYDVVSSDQRENTGEGHFAGGDDPGDSQKDSKGFKGFKGIP